MGRIRIVPARPGDAAEVAAFNERMRVAGVTHRLSTDRPFREYALTPGCPVIIERYFAWVDDKLRGGVVVKRIPFWIGGAGPSEVAFYGYPVSEGTVNPEFGFLGLMIQKFVSRRHPLAYGLGTGGLDLPVSRLMMATGWEARPVPFRFQVFRAAPFLRELQLLRRRSAMVRGLADVSAATGLGSLALGCWNLIRAVAGRRLRCGGWRGEAVTAWGSWSDEIWESVRESSALIGDRSAATLSALYPDGHLHLRRLRVARDDGQVVGWVVITVARQRDSRHFGNLCLGALVDGLARPGVEVPVVSVALRAMREAGADLAVTNLSSTPWVRACDRVGMAKGPTNFFFFLSPELRRRLSGAVSSGQYPFFTRGDGDGPIHLW